MATEIKDIPDTGTRKKYAYLIFTISSIFALIMIVFIFINKIDKDKLDMIMLVFDGWIAISGSTLGIYTISEAAKKHSHAVLNRE